jgi:GMP reductase
MFATGTFAMGEATRKVKMLTAIHKFYPLPALVNNFKRHNCFYTLGLKDEDFEKLEAFAKVRLPNKINIDAANGYTCYFVEKVKRLRERFPYAILMAGNVCTPEMTQELILAGADIVKVGVGSGSVCTTRLMTGVGYPQFSAVADCADSAHGLGGLICSDGGATTPGDVAKAMGAGADLVMLGGMLAGTDECEGNDEVDGDFEFFGMSSNRAQDLFYGGRKSYAAAEGKVVRIPHKGPVTPILEEIMGGLRSACSYVGAATLKDFSKCCSFIRVSRTHNTVFGE